MRQNQILTLEVPDERLSRLIYLLFSQKMVKITISQSPKQRPQMSCFVYNAKIFSF